LVADGPTGPVSSLYDDLAALEGVLVGPVDRVRRTGFDRADELSVDEEADGRNGCARGQVDLRNDPHLHREPGAAKRRGDVDRWDLGVGGRDGRGGHGLPLRYSRELQTQQ